MRGEEPAIKRMALRASPSQRDASWPADHPRKHFERYDVGVVAYDQFPAESPIRRLYVASASAHPGAAVHGACGANAARAALAHHRLRR
mgnify:CR=1 FL=1